MGCSMGAGLEFVPMKFLLFGEVFWMVYRVYPNEAGMPESKAEEPGTWTGTEDATVLDVFLGIGMFSRNKWEYVM